jgi:hypothetical protein
MYRQNERVVEHKAKVLYELKIMHLQVLLLMKIVLRVYFRLTRARFSHSIAGINDFKNYHFLSGGGGGSPLND